ncbi:MAG TPA: FAD/NAD(P)-binding oxidoreductase, partial [Saprospiraceae bacterium]|nr:FAD/NAD(P)-binding oxidoreductase [Saprospiraceae bacterium]
MHIVILGNGISGVTCARCLRKWSQHDISLISDESDEFFSRTALMYVFMGHMREQDTRPYSPDFWAQNRIGRIRARVQHVDFQEKKLITADQGSIPYDVLVLAVGSLPKRFGWRGEHLAGVQGLYHLQDLENMERHTSRLLRLPHRAAERRAVVVGGGLIGVEMAEMLHSRHIPITFLVREQEFGSAILPTQEAAMVSRHLREHGIDLRLSEELDEILPDPSGQHCAAVTTRSGDTVPCSFVGLTVGVSPNIGFLQDSGL